MVYEAVHAVVDRAFAFAPNHNTEQPLLHRDCPAYALDPNSDVMPVPSTLNVIGAALARAQELAPVHLHAAEFNIGHAHTMVSAIGDQLTSIANFYRNAMSQIARRLNWLQAREGHLLGGAMRLTPCDDRQAAQKLLYALTNSVKDGLTPTVRHSPLFNTYRIQALGRTQLYWDIRFRDYHAAGGVRNPRLRLKDFIVWRQLEITPLPCFAGMKPEQIQTFVRKQVHEVEEEKAQEHKRQGRTFMAVSKLFEVDPKDKPKEPRKKGARQPLVHASSLEAEKAYEEKYNEVRQQHRVASIAFRAGDFEVEFPPGTYRPTIVKVVDSS